MEGFEDEYAPYHVEEVTHGWGLKQWTVLDAYYRIVHEGLPETQARRLAACLNYCHNYPTEWLEKQVADGIYPEVSPTGKE